MLQLNDLPIQICHSEINQRSLCLLGLPGVMGSPGLDGVRGAPGVSNYSGSPGDNGPAGPPGQPGIFCLY